jgi:hypothetical protein
MGHQSSSRPFLFQRLSYCCPIFSYPPHAAVSHQDVLRYLLERGADPNARDKAGSTPAHIAVANANIEVGRFPHSDCSSEVSACGNSLFRYDSTQTWAALGWVLVEDASGLEYCKSKQSAGYLLPSLRCGRFCNYCIVNVCAYTVYSTASSRKQLRGLR